MSTTHHMEPGEFGEGVNLTDKPQGQATAVTISDERIAEIQRELTKPNRIPSTRDQADIFAALTELAALRSAPAPEWKGMLKRYDPEATRSLPEYAVSVFQGMKEAPDGEWVRYSDLPATPKGADE